MEPTKHLSPDGKPYMRPVPPVMKDRAVRSFTLQLVYDTRTADYDWIYNFRLAGRGGGRRHHVRGRRMPLVRERQGVGPGQAARSPATPRISAATSIATAAASTSTASPATPALLMSFEPRIGLKMKGGCGGGGIYRIKPATSGITFRLQTASAETCQPLEEWASR